MKGGWKKLQPPVIGYGAYEVMLMRLFFGILLYYNLPVLEKFPTQPEPNGLALFNIDFTWASNPEVMGILKWILVPVLAIYVWGKVPWLTLPYMFWLSLGVGTLKNSQGSISHVTQIITLVLMVQCGWAVYLAVRRALGMPHHFRTGWTGRSMEVFLSQSAMASIYLTTAINKLIRSDGQWLWDIRRIGVDLEKTWQQDYYNRLGHDAPQWATAIKNLVTEHPIWAVILFGPGLLAELFAPLALYGRKWALTFGVLLIILHLGAIHVMRLTFEQNIWCLVIFFVNVPFWIHVFLKWNKKVSADRAREVRKAR